MSVVDYNKVLEKLKAFDMQAEKELSVLLSMEIIPTNATDDQLFAEFKNINMGNPMFKDAFKRLSNEVQTGLLHLIASLTMQSKKRQTRGGGDDGVIVLPDIDRKPNTYLSNKNLVFSVLCLFFGLFLLITAKNMATSLGAEYGLEITFAGFVGSFLNPLSSATSTIQTIINSLLERSQQEVAYQVGEVCGAAGGGWVSNILTILQGPGEKIVCGLTVTEKVMTTEFALQQAKIVNNISSITNLVRAGYGIVGLSSGNIALMIEGPDGNISRFISNIPGLKNALRLFGPGSGQPPPLAITDGPTGGKRKSKKARKGRKSKKARKGRKSKKARKA